MNEEFLDGRDAELLSDASRNSLAGAAENSFETIAFPSVSTGAFHFQKHLAARIASQTIKEFLAADDEIRRLRLVFFSETDAKMFVKYQNFR